MISVHFQGKPFNITVIQVYAPTTNAEEAEVEWLYDDLQDILELTPKKDIIFITGDWNAKVGNQELPEVIGKFAFVLIHFIFQRKICLLLQLLFYFLLSHSIPYDEKDFFFFFYCGMQM